MLCRASNGELVALQLGWAFSRNSEFGWESKNLWGPRISSESD
jgi:hypothetical protein